MSPQQEQLLEGEIAEIIELSASDPREAFRRRGELYMRFGVDETEVVFRQLEAEARIAAKL